MYFNHSIFFRKTWKAIHSSYIFVKYINSQIHVRDTETELSVVYPRFIQQTPLGAWSGSSQEALQAGLPCEDTFTCSRQRLLLQKQDAASPGPHTGTPSSGRGAAPHAYRHCNTIRTENKSILKGKRGDSFVLAFPWLESF